MPTAHQTLELMFSSLRAGVEIQVNGWTLRFREPRGLMMRAPGGEEAAPGLYGRRPARELGSLLATALATEPHEYARTGRLRSSPRPTAAD